MQFLEKQLVLLSALFCIQKKGKAKNTFYQCEYKKPESISTIFWHVEANINSIKILKNYLWRSSHLTKFSEIWE